jgi:hypothetical protein
MIRAVGNKRLFLTNYEFDVYNKIIENIDKSEFNETFDSDNNGTILSVLSSSKTDDMVTQFLFNIMINQRVRSMDKIISKVQNIEKRLNSVESKLEEW